MSPVRFRLLLSVTSVFALGAIVTVPGLTRVQGAAATAAPVETAAVMPAGELAAYGAVGFSVALDLRLHELQWTPAQFDAFVAGLRASYSGATYSLDDEKTHAGFEAIRQKIRSLKAAAAPAPAAPASATNDADVEAFMEQMRRKFGLQLADSGLLYRVTVSSSGPRPTKDDVVTISFQGTSPGTPKEGLPQLSAAKLRVKVADLMPGLAEGVQMLALDSAIVLLLRPELSFGHGAWPAGVEPGTPLFFNLQLHDLEAAEAVP